MPGTVQRRGKTEKVVKSRTTLWQASEHNSAQPVGIMGELITKTVNLEVCKTDDGDSSNFNVKKNYKFVTNSKHVRRKMTINCKKEGGTRRTGHTDTGRERKVL